MGYLDGLDGWFDLQGDFRHSLAHRIPLYVPPYVVTDDKSKAKRELDDRMADAVNIGAHNEYYRLSEEQEKLGEFWPVMTHSFEENPSYVHFHFQILEDFAIIENLGRKMLEELDR